MTRHSKCPYHILIAVFHSSSADSQQVIGSPKIKSGEDTSCSEPIKQLLMVDGNLIQCPTINAQTDSQTFILINWMGAPAGEMGLHIKPWARFSFRFLQRPESLGSDSITMSHRNSYSWL